MLDVIDGWMGMRPWRSRKHDKRSHSLCMRFLALPCRENHSYNNIPLSLSFLCCQHSFPALHKHDVSRLHGEYDRQRVMLK